MNPKEVDYSKISYNITLNHANLRVIEKALDLYTRIGIGQFEALENPLEYMNQQAKVFKDYDRRQFNEDIKKLKSKLFGIDNGSYGISSGKVHDIFKIAYDISKTLQKQIADVEEHMQHSTWHDGPVLHLGPEPLITITVGNKMSKCNYASKTYPMIKRARDYLKEEDFKHLEELLTDHSTTELDVEHHKLNLVLARDKIERLENLLEEIHNVVVCAAIENAEEICKTILGIIKSHEVNLPYQSKTEEYQRLIKELEYENGLLRDLGDIQSPVQCGHCSKIRDTAVDPICDCIENPKLINEAEYICTVCAESYGGIWPTGHVATFHTGNCNLCGENKSLANVGDWNWPDKKHRGFRD